MVRHRYEGRVMVRHQNEGRVMVQHQYEGRVMVRHQYEVRVMLRHQYEGRVNVAMSGLFISLGGWSNHNDHLHTTSCVLATFD